MLPAFALFLIALFVAATSEAHEGHDHGEEQVETTQSGQAMIVRVKRAEDCEVTLKHPPIEPDKELSARLMVTKFETNEPVGKVKVVLVIEGNGFQNEIPVTETSTTGLYEFNLPPMQQGDYKLKARLDVAGNLAIANFGNIQVKPLEIEPSANQSLWARTVLIVIGTLFLLAVVVALIALVVKFVQRERSVEDETVTV